MSGGKRRETQKQSHGSLYDRSIEYEPYDANGNRTSVTRGNIAYGYGPYGDNDQFTSGENYSFSSYDNDGNPGVVNLNGPVWYPVYDEANRVTSISGSLTATFRYDGDGRRVQRVDATGTTRFVYDGDQVVLETNGSNAVTLYRTPGVGYVRSGTGGGQRYDRGNLQGSTVAVTDGAGAYLGFTEHDAYGREVYSEGTDRGNYRFGGKHGYVNDDATGMQLLGARYYLPALGRFLTQDPIGHEGGLNLYAYCDNSPLLNVDPDGIQRRPGLTHRLVAFSPSRLPSNR